jgi:putative transposase
MARPLRIEFCGALYHVTSRGDRREPIFEDDADRQTFLAILAEGLERFNWLCHAYCLMTNHYHLVVGTPQGNLSKGMRQLNGVYTQASNRRHQRTGHLFQGRFKGILVDKESYLLELTRYVVLNPVRAGIVAQVQQWPWSSYRAMVGEAPVPAWLATDALLAQFGEQREEAQRRYRRRFVAEGIGRESLWAELRQQIYLGDEEFVARMQAQATVQGDALTIPRVQRRAPPPALASFATQSQGRDEEIVAAYATGAYSYREIAQHFGIHPATVGRVVRRRMQRCGNRPRIRELTPDPRADPGPAREAPSSHLTCSLLRTPVVFRIVGSSRNTSMSNLLDRITINPEQCGGRPCIRGMRIRVVDVLDLLAAGLSTEQVLEELPDIESEDIAAALRFAARKLDHPVLAA